MNPNRNEILSREGQIRENHLAAIAKKIRNTAMVFYIQSSHTYTAGDLEKVLEQAQYHRVVKYGCVNPKY